MLPKRQSFTELSKVTSLQYYKCVHVLNVFVKQGCNGCITTPFSFKWCTKEVSMCGSGDCIYVTLVTFIRYDGPTRIQQSSRSSGHRQPVRNVIPIKALHRLYCACSHLQPHDTNKFLRMCNNTLGGAYSTA